MEFITDWFKNDLIIFKQYGYWLKRLTDKLKIEWTIKITENYFDNENYFLRRVK